MLFLQYKNVSKRKNILYYNRGLGKNGKVQKRMVKAIHFCTNESAGINEIKLENVQPYQPLSVILKKIKTVIVFWVKHNHLKTFKTASIGNRPVPELQREYGTQSLLHRPTPWSETPLKSKHVRRYCYNTTILREFIASWLSSGTQGILQGAYK